MRVELERRLAQTAAERHIDPAFRDLPVGDRVALLGLGAAAVVGTLVLQAN